MKSAISLLAAGALAVASASLIGCSSEQNPPPAHNGTEGGNGAYGTNPQRPGSYQGEQGNPQNTSPATQPAGS